jgi:hypothetical protein
MRRLALVLAIVAMTSCSSYVRRAYCGKSEGTSIRGYPTIDPPAGYTGVWTHYKHDGSKLAEVPYMNGQTHGTSFWYRDDGSVYLIRHYELGHYSKDYLIEPPPKTPARIPFWYPAHYR